MCVCVQHVCVRTGTRACMRLCAHAYVCVCASVCTYVRTLLLEQ